MHEQAAHLNVLIMMLVEAFLQLYAFQAYHIALLPIASHAAWHCSTLHAPTAVHALCLQRFLSSTMSQGVCRGVLLLSIAASQLPQGGVRSR